MAEWKSVTLPLETDAWAVLSFSYPLTRSQYVRIIQLLDVMSDGLVRDEPTEKAADAD